MSRDGSVVRNRDHEYENSAARRALDVEESIERLKERARVGIPNMAASVRAWNQGAGNPPYWRGTLQFGATAADRNAVYSAMWHQLPPNKGRYWFQAATMVTGGGGVKSMEGTLSEIGTRATSTTVGDLKLVIAGNEFLYPYNLRRFGIAIVDGLRNGH